jgi:hypothetical protein
MKQKNRRGMACHARPSALRTMGIYGLLFIGVLFGLGLLGIAADGHAAVPIGVTWVLGGLPVLIGMAQATGANAKVVAAIESVEKTLPVKLVHDCEAAWDELVDADATVTADATVFKQGTKSAKFVVAANLSAGDIVATDSLAALNLSACKKIGFWFHSSVALDAGDYQLLLDDTAQCASVLEALDIPAVAAGEVNTWKYMKIALAAPAGDTAIVSVGFKCVVDKPGTFYIDDIRGLENEGILLPWKSASAGLTVALEESDVVTEGRQPAKPSEGALDGKLSYSTELNPYNAAWFFRQLLGKAVVTDLTGGIGQAVFTISALPVGFSFEIQNTDIPSVATFSGCKGGTWSITVNATGKIALDIAGKASVEQTETRVSVLDGAPLNYGHNPFQAKVATLTEGGTSASGKITSLKIDYDNDLSGEPTVGSGGTMDGIVEGKPKLKFSIDTMFKDTTYYAKAKNRTESSFKVELPLGTGDGSAGNEKFTLEMTETLYELPERKLDGPKGLKVPFNGIAYFQDDAGGETIKITIKAPLDRLQALLPGC